MLHMQPSVLIVPDTNVCVSGILRSNTPPAQIIELWRDGLVEFAVCEAILEEIRRVLSKPYFQQHTHWTPQQIEEYVGELRAGSYLVPATTPIHVSPDLNDNMLFACAIEAHADYIVSGDDSHVLAVGEYQGIRTVSPREFVEMELIQAAS